MSSTPFCLGIPVVNEVPLQEGAYVLRAKNEAGLSQAIQKLQKNLSKKDLIKIYIIGYRPDCPIPVGRYFAEIHVGIGKAEEWQSNFGLWNCGFFHRIATGMRGESE